MQLIGEMLDNTVKAYPDREAVVFEDLKWTYAQFLREVNKRANGLRSIGINKGDVVLVHLSNSPEIMMIHYAIIKIGAIVVPLNVMYVAHEVSYIGDDTRAKAIILDSAFLPVFQEARHQLPALQHVVVVGDEVPDDAWNFREMVSVSSEDPSPCTADFDDIVSIIYTSGTTGRPKGATQTHRSILANVSSCCDFNKFTCEDRLLCALPLFNNFAINVVMMSAVKSGATLVMVDRFEAEKVLNHITAHKATYFAGTPTMFVYLLQAYDSEKHSVATLRVVNSGGAHCPASLAEETEKKFGVIFLDGYGQTEACGFTTLNPVVGVRETRVRGNSAFKYLD